jgi:phospholipase C
VSPTRPSRREFLQGTGAIVGASAVAGGFPLFGASDLAFGSPAAASAGLADIDHVVVLMMENRSFDNVVGWLYDSGSVPGGQSFDGLSGKVLSNPVPGGGTANPGQETVLSYPNPDPGELFEDVYASLFNTNPTDPPLPYNWTELTTTEEATQELDWRIEALRALNTASPPPPATVTVTPKFTG